VDESGSNTLRLTFAREDVPTIRQGLARLGRVVRRALA
jgi:DNA-binding transcriptional MocR family regulator